MDSERLWTLFCDTGDPVCWLYYRAAMEADAEL